jgi:O-acetyl-ADP-ribose deacetylase
LPPIGHTPHPLSSNQSQAKSDVERKSSLSPKPAAAEALDWPVTEPAFEERPAAEVRELEENITHASVDDLRSEDDWEEVDTDDGGPVERLDDEPVEVGKAPSATDVQSVHSSGISFHELPSTDSTPS